jgi:iron complex transport system permease protein
MIKKSSLIAGMFILATLACLCAGRYPIHLPQVAGLLLSGMGIHAPDLAAPGEMMTIFWNIRVPRVLLSILVGAGIATAGAVFQALFRNPLASPDILGVTAGASFGAALAIMVLTPLAWVIQTSAFLSGILAVTLAYLLAAGSRDASPSVLVIAGIVISAIFQAGLSILMYQACPYDQLARIVFWTMGSFHTASWEKVRFISPILFSGIFLMVVFSWRLNLMTQAEEDALAMGIHIVRWRIFYVVVGTLMVACAVAIVGRVAWIGLIVPHIARYLAGAEHRRLIPVAAVTGGLFLMVMDTLARTLMLSEIPISIVTSIFGAPFLGYLIVSAGKRRMAP